MEKSRLPSVNGERLWQRHLDLAAIGATAAGGVHRMALTSEDIRAHRLIADWALARSFEIELDPIGNMFLRRRGEDGSLPPIASGSHTDTQPYGGQFDGALGVLCAFETLEALDDAGIRTTHSVEAIVWNNEEGARYVPGLSGSGAYCGIYELDEMLACKDDDGVSMRDCVDALHHAIPEAGVRKLGSPIAGFIEAHIEQGVILEEAGEPIGVVTGMQGNRRFTVTVTGENAHSGTTPRSRRKDAFVAATDMAVALRDVFWDDEDIARFTIGRFDVTPGAKSVVPGRVEFFIDFRHPSADALRSLGDQVAAVCERMKGPCEVSVEQASSADPVVFPDHIQKLIKRSADARELANRPILSCAGHDARYLAEICPAGMVFIPCWQGISHNEAERAERKDVVAGAQVICDTVTLLAEPVE